MAPWPSYSETTPKKKNQGSYSKIFSRLRSRTVEKGTDHGASSPPASLSPVSVSPSLFSLPPTPDGERISSRRPGMPAHRTKVHFWGEGEKEGGGGDISEGRHLHRVRFSSLVTSRWSQHFSATPEHIRDEPETRFLFINYSRENR